ncbi:MAG: hypothetical protein H0X39_13505 [Actinobacteria bacterium]|nr:hypothetical protein [Actinomycetota bacterium]
MQHFTPGEEYWYWRNELLRHPDGRSPGGEACVRCGGEIPVNASPEARDRHVCSPACQLRLARWFTRQVEKGVYRYGDVARNPRDVPVPHVFAGIGDNEVPFEFSGYGPLDGDVLRRYNGSILYASGLSKAAVHVESGQVLRWRHLNAGAITIFEEQNCNGTILPLGST